MTSCEHEAVRQDGARFFVAPSDEHAWPDIERARSRLKAAQVPFLDRLQAPSPPTTHSPALRTGCCRGSFYASTACCARAASSSGRTSQATCSRGASYLMSIARGRRRRSRPYRPGMSSSSRWPIKSNRSSSRAARARGRWMAPDRELHPNRPRRAACCFRLTCVLALVGSNRFPAVCEQRRLGRSLASSVCVGGRHRV
jgi:hypothetical protein